MSKLSSILRMIVVFKIYHFYRSITKKANKPLVINMNDIEEIFGKPISTYTSDQAAEDGILFDITDVNMDWRRGIFRYVTTNLMNRGYFIKTDEGQKVNIPNLLDLLNQAKEILRRQSNCFQEFGTFFVGNVELPSGKKQEVFIEINELNKFTILLPEDH